jgi:nitrite reductase (NO-forming)
MSTYPVPTPIPTEPLRRHPGVVATAIASAGLVACVATVSYLSRSDGPGAAAPAPPAVVKATAAGATRTSSSMPGMAMPAAAATPAAAASTKPYDATLPAVGPGTVHRYTLTIHEQTITVAPGVRYDGWLFGTTAPGPVIHVRQGDTVDVTLKNGGAMPHSVDFHAARVAPDVAFKTVPGGGSVHFRFKATTAGAFMYHCGTAPALAHIANGMYGAIVVDPKGGLPKVDRSYVLVASEWYLNGDGKAAPASLDMARAHAMNPDYVTWNGVAGQYKTHPLTAKVGDEVRFYVVAAGPSLDTDFHVVGTVLDTVWLDATTTDVLHGVQTQLVPAGGGMVFDTRFDAKGLYPFVSHSFASVDKGQVGLVNVGNVAGTMSH